MMEPALVRNAADPRQVREAARKERWTRRDELEDVRALLTTRQGRRFLWRYLTICGVFQSSFSISHEQTYFREGERNVGLQMIADIQEADASAYMKMMEESQQDRPAGETEEKPSQEGGSDG